MRTLRAGYHDVHLGDATRHLPLLGRAGVVKGLGPMNIAAGNTFAPDARIVRPTARGPVVQRRVDTTGVSVTCVAGTLIVVRANQCRPGNAVGQLA